LGKLGETSYQDYKRALLQRFRQYRQQHWPIEDDLFDPQHAHVFKADLAFCNLFSWNLDRLLPRGHHTWLPDMGSSQALAVSILGTMLKRGNLELLAQVPDDQGQPLLAGFVLAGPPQFEYTVSALHERKRTQVDLFLPGQQGHVAIECKFWEQQLAPCAQVAARRCNGHYAPQPGRAPGQRCALTERKVAYWTYIPQLFRWRADEDYVPCPLQEPYQLVRNVLAAAVEPATRQVWGQPVAVLLYDARNPMFHPGGRVEVQFQAVRSALQGPAAFRRATWQALAQVLAKQGRYEDLLAWLREKYGLLPADAAA